MINLNSVSRQALQALNRLREPGNEALLQFLESQLAEAKQKLVYADDMGLIHRARASRSV